jgi:hypothetical protein
MMKARPPMCLLVALLAGLAPAATTAAPWRALQAATACPCEVCVGKHNSVADCESFGLDCSCYAECSCATCVGAGNQVADCESFGLDCSCYTGGGVSGAACDDGRELADKAAEVNKECCDEATEDCSSGRPATCNLGCAHVLLPFFEKCAVALGPAGVAEFSDVVALCRAVEPPSPPLKDCLHTGCGEYGVCSQGACVCAHGYAGAACEIDVGCIGVSCGEHGTCNAGSCVCESDDFSGTHCEIECDGHGSVHGGSCVCESDKFSGAHCEIECDGHGSVDSSGDCVCTDRYTGANCEQAPLQCCSSALEISESHVAKPSFDC